MPEKELPFLTVFARYRPAPELLPALEGWLVASAVVESSTRVMDAKLRCPEPPPERSEEHTSELQSLSC